LILDSKWLFDSISSGSFLEPGLDAAYEPEEYIVV